MEHASVRHLGRKSSSLFPPLAMQPSLQKHFNQCSGQTFTCIDCSLTFDRKSVLGHSTCVTEHEKYALGATKPGGSAAHGFQAPVKSNGNMPENEPSGLEFLSLRPPWKCSICNVSCTSKETLLSHAAGVKHKRRARAAAAGSANGAQVIKPTQIVSWHVEWLLWHFLFWFP
jgi:cell growth-regulating nucleolar protein